MLLPASRRLCLSQSVADCRHGCLGRSVCHYSSHLPNVPAARWQTNGSHYLYRHTQDCNLPIEQHGGTHNSHLPATVRQDEKPQTYGADNCPSYIRYPPATHASVRPSVRSNRSTRGKVYSGLYLLSHAAMVGCYPTEPYCPYLVPCPASRRSSV